MPTYEYKCESCGKDFDRILPMSEYDAPQTCDCGGPGKRQVSMPNFILKGDDWVGKNNRIAGQMADKNRKLDKRQEELKRDGPGVRLAPNVDGERVDTWTDAKKLAESKGKDGSTYDAKIREESSK